MRKIGKNVEWFRGQYRVRIAIPAELQAIIGKSALIENLGADFKAAEKKSHAALANFHDVLDNATAHLEASKPTLASAAKALFKSELDSDLQERLNSKRPDLELLTRIYTDKLRLVAAGLINGEEAEALIGYAANDLIERKLATASTATERATLLKALADIRLDTLAVSQSRDKGDVYPPEPRSALLLTPDPEPLPPVIAIKKDGKQPGGINLDDLLVRFHAERVNGADTTKQERVVMVRMLSGFVGKDRPVSQITRADMLEFKNALIHMPSNSQQRFPGMTVKQAIKANQKREKPFPVLNHKTINEKWLMHVNVMFNWAVNNSLMESNPVKGVKVDPGKGFTEPPRVPFTADDIKAIFSNPFFTAAKKFESRHWALLVALYTGARSSSEIQRIRLENVYVEQGITVIHLSEASKNRQSKRIIPVHKALIDLGFLQHVEALRKKGQDRLFPDWEPEDKINRWFLRTYKKACGINDSRKVFHSFRHSLKTALARYGVNRDVSDLITGHADQSVAGQYIADKEVTMVELMAQGINRVDFGLGEYLKPKA